MLRILIADDHPLFRQGLADLITREFGTVTIGEAGTAADFFDLVRTQEWDAAVMDVNMPGRAGPEILRDLKRERPRLPVLVLSMYAEDQYAVRMIKAGADGYVTKASASQDVCKALKHLLAGERYISPTVAEHLALVVRAGSEQLPHETLSDREFQVFRLIGSGKTVKEIAEDLALSAATVSTYRARILEKMQMKNNAELIRYAIQQGLVE
ncbi:MAG TPA: response regulator transcription factor [Nitrospirales bacterium]